MLAYYCVQYQIITIFMSEKLELPRIKNSCTIHHMNYLQMSLVKGITNKFEITSLTVTFAISIVVKTMQGIYILECYHL